MIRLWNHLVLSKEFIKKRRPEKRRLSEILDRSRRASSIPPSRESLCLPENRRTGPLAPGDLHYSGPLLKCVRRPPYGTPFPDMIRLWNHLVLSKEFIKKRRPEKRRLSEILDRSRLQASSISLSREAYAFLTPKKTVTARNLFIIADPQNRGSKS